MDRLFDGTCSSAECGQKVTIFMQLTLHAIVWDVQGASADRLDREFEEYPVTKLILEKIQAETLGECIAKTPARQMDMETPHGLGRRSYEKMEGIAALNYRRLCGQLQRAHVRQEEALLVTEDAALLEYMKQAASGMALVYYERPGAPGCLAADFIVQGFEEIGIQFFDRIQKRKNKLPWNILYTKRTYVREITPSDLAELYELYQGDGITNYMEPLYEWEQEAEYIRSYIDCMYYYYGYGMWIIRERETGRLLGRAGIEHRDMGDAVWPELGYVIGANDQGKGYATEVCQAVIAYAAQELGFDTLHCFIHPDNLASLRVAEKLGFQPAVQNEKPDHGLLHFQMKLMK